MLNELLEMMAQSQSGASSQLSSAGAPENEMAEPLETLAPLPGSGDEESAGAVEDEEAGLSEAEIIVVNDIAWTLIDAVNLGESLESGSDEIADLVADGRLLGVRFTLTNQGEETLGLMTVPTFGTLDLVTKRLIR